MKKKNENLKPKHKPNIKRKVFEL